MPAPDAEASVIAGIVAQLKAAGEIFRNDVFRSFRRRPRHDLDTVPGEEILCALSHAAGDNHGDALFLQPARQDARFMGWGGHQLRGRDGFLLGVDGEDGKLIAMPKMLAEHSVDRRYGDFHDSDFSLGCVVSVFESAKSG